MNPTKETATPNPEETAMKETEPFTMKPNTTLNKILEGDDEDEIILEWDDDDYVPRVKRTQSQKGPETSKKDPETQEGDQAQEETSCLQESGAPSSTATGSESVGHLPEDSGSSSVVASTGEDSRMKMEPVTTEPLVFQPDDQSPSPSQEKLSEAVVKPSRPSHVGGHAGELKPSINACSLRLSSKFKRDNLLPISDSTVDDLKRQNIKLIEAIMKIQKNYASDKKRFHEVLFGIDKALSSLPIRLEKIRVRNQKNLSIIKSCKFYSGDGNENLTEESGCDSSLSSESLTLTSQDGQSQVSFRMKSLLQKIDQLNELIRNIHEGDSSPIELLVNSELYAISLLKKEIKSTKRQIEDNKTDTETAHSFEDSPKTAIEECSSKAKTPFSNELNKASNFKIFENHMILQEEALNLLTRKIKETEEALLKEVEAKEGLKRENETMAKEIFRLKSGGEEVREEKFLKTEKLKPESEATGNRPYRLIKELKGKLEEKEKALIAWKSKYSRSETANSNKINLLEGERKKNAQLEAANKNLRLQNKSLSSHINSLQFLNDQLKEQLQILKHQVEILASQRMEELSSNSEGSKLKQILRERKEVEEEMEEMKKYYERQLQEVRFQLQRHMGKNEEFADTFRELLVVISNFGMERDRKSIKNPTYTRIREILHITPSDLELLFSVYAKSATQKEVERLFQDFQSIVDGEENEFSETLSAWFFDIILEKMLRWGSEEKLSKFIMTSN